MIDRTDEPNEPYEAEDPPPEFVVASGLVAGEDGGELARAADAREHELDHALLRRAQTGEEAAFAELVRRHQARAWRVARNLVASDEDAQDLAQEAFVRVFKSLATFDFQHGFTTWLYRIVTNLAIDHLRRRRPVTSTARSVEDEGEFDLVDENVAQPAAALESSELALEVQSCLAALAPHFQSVLVLREIEGLACNEIAKIVGATHVTVRWRLHRGRKLFQEEWERRLRLRELGGDAEAGVESADGTNSAGPTSVDGNAGIGRRSAGPTRVDEGSPRDGVRDEMGPRNDARASGQRRGERSSDGDASGRRSDQRKRE